MDTSFIFNAFLRLFMIFLAVLGSSVFISVFSFLLNKIKTTDYSDQTGWKNFRKPFLSVALSALAIQLIVFGAIIAALVLAE